MEMNNNLNAGTSASYGNQYPVQNVGNTEAGYSHNWQRTPRPFGLNVRVPQMPIGERTQTVIKRTLVDLAMAPVKPVVDFFKKNENVFNGNISAEIESLNKQQKWTVELLENADEVVMNSSTPSFMMDM